MLEGDRTIGDGWRSTAGRHQRGTVVGQENVRRVRLVVAVCVLLSLIAKLFLAARTFGTNDAASWVEFARGERLAGPIRIYSLVWPHDLYNHPPLIGYYLHLVNLAQNWGWSTQFTIRLVASLADVVTAFVVLELLRRRRPYRPWVPAASAIAVALSPVLLEVSGFHANTDPLFTMLTLTGLWLLVDRRQPALAGVAIGLAVGVKIIPMVVVPCLLVYAWKTGRRTGIRFTVALAAVVALTWGPAVLLEFGPLLHHVIGYAGTGPSHWGIIQLGHWLGDPWWVGFLTGTGRGLVVVLCAVVPCVAVWRRPGAVLQAVAWSLIAFLALAVSFGVQYSVWPLAASYLIEFWSATAYNVSAGLVLTEIYDHWSGGFPWYRAYAVQFTAPEINLLMIPWVFLLLILVLASRGLFRRRVVRAAGPPPGSPRGRNAVGSDRVAERTSADEG